MSQGSIARKTFKPPVKLSMRSDQARDWTSRAASTACRSSATSTVAPPGRRTSKAGAGAACAVTCIQRTGACLLDFAGEGPRFCVNPWLCSQFQNVFLEMPAILAKAEAESPLRRYSTTASAVLRTRPRASRFKTVSWLSITWDIPDTPRAPFQVRSHGRYGDGYGARRDANDPYADWLFPVNEHIHTVSINADELSEMEIVSFARGYRRGSSLPLAILIIKGAT